MKNIDIINAIIGNAAAKNGGITLFCAIKSKNGKVI